MSAGAKPLISMLVPAYNAEATLAETLRSALASSYSNVEVVLVDDGSTDRTPEIAEKFAHNDKRLRVFRQTHGGVSAALNRGLAEVRGDYVARLDADDLWHPTKLEKQFNLIASDPAVALVYTFVRYVDGGGHVLRDAPPQRLAGHALCECAYNGIVGGGSSVLFRRSVLDSVGGFDEQLSVWEDLLLHLQVAAADAIAVVPEYLVGYRLRPDSSSTNPQKSLRSWRLARRRIKAAFPQMPAFVQRWSHARRLLELAEEFAVDGRYTTSAKLIAECLAFDFVRTSTFLAFRLHRRMSGDRRSLESTGPHFDELGPKASFGPTEFDAGLEGTRLRALDESRDRMLRSVDRKIAVDLSPAK